ncbi:MAG: hypothetical protein A2X56_00170 [Nitrospirae bacterium GWC2_57_13]|jgi:cytochrome c-type biogenesis protein CcmE|nr:MAG: hypothetical protein A2072_07120 [Nitrospirae bacterium GWC1_57_7]OGW28409.1 MAG: hypothetical protein A2X56_00170 [Nitrospirae bacterium GWC2_57_13]OGW46602.1 MAG: hypothetical protein A2X57_05235 [Nitrospirae bacterium GWD2_57_8]HAR45895.1 hypothetical protein [Nitrospiraceae bacterium]HAS53203.1 hypothetical protein [Nitrospiraceae bacterium]
MVRTKCGNISRMIMAGIILAGMSAAAYGGTVSAVQIAQRLDKTKHTTAEIKSFLKGLKGQQVQADGRVNDVRIGKKNAKVVVLVKVPERSQEFVVDVQMETNAAEKFRKDERVACTGEFVRHNNFTLNGVVIKGSCKK